MRISYVTEPEKNAIIKLKAVFKIKFKKGMEVQYKMGDMLKVYYDGHTSGLYWPIDVMMTPGISGFNILSKSPRNL